MIHLKINGNNSDHLLAKLELEKRTLAKKITYDSNAQNLELTYENKTYSGKIEFNEFLKFIEPYTKWDQSTCDNWDGIC